MEQFIEICESGLVHLPIDELKDYYYITDYVGSTHIICEDCIELYISHVSKIIMELISDNKLYQKIKLHTELEEAAEEDPEVAEDEYLKQCDLTYYDTYAMSEMFSQFSYSKIKIISHIMPCTEDVNTWRDVGFQLTIILYDSEEHRIKITISRDILDTLDINILEKLIMDMLMANITQIPEDEVLALMKEKLEGATVINPPAEPADKDFNCEGCNHLVHYQDERYYIYQNKKYCINCMYGIIINEAADRIGGFDAIGINDNQMLESSYSIHNTEGYKNKMIGRAANEFDMDITVVSPSF